MKTSKVIYQKVFSLGNYENEKIGVEIEVEASDDVNSVLQKARSFVEFNHKVNGFVREIDECEHIILNPDDFTGSQVRRARERKEQLEKIMREGQQLLLQ
jgi:hypothetical protein